MDELISVIVPVYKVEKYLDRCVTSIVNQTYRNIEIILVDDGSPDNCPAMCDDWAAKDSRIKVIHKENGGVSDARNAGMAVATGELMGFVDSDDWISLDMYQQLYDDMIKNDSDISACGVEMVWEDGITQSQRLTKRGSFVLNGYEAMQAFIEGSWIQAEVYNRLYKTNLIKDIRFPVGKYHEDNDWTTYATGNAQKVSGFGTPLYFYVQHPDSIMGKDLIINRLDTLDAKVNCLMFVQERYPDLAVDLKTDVCFYCLWSEQRVLRCLKGTEQKRGREKISRVWHYLYDAEPRNLKERLWLTLVRISLPGTAWLRNFLHIGL